MSVYVDNINPSILIQCREQIGLEVYDIQKTIKNIQEIEEGNTKPTYKQLDFLSQLYNVPRWVFIAEELPAEYQFEKTVPAFRQFVNADNAIFDDPKIRRITAKVESYRKIVIEFSEDEEDSVPVFNPPKINKSSSPVVVAQIIRKWLEISDEIFDFNEWKELLESKGIFIFLTSKYRGWSHIDKNVFRGLAIYHSKLPIIVINDSDSKKAQSFTLIHELGHLLRNESALDDWYDHDHNVEKWCNDLAGNTLIPNNLLEEFSVNYCDLRDVKKLSRVFKVSPYAFIVRIRQIGMISQAEYKILENELKNEYETLQEILKSKDGGPPRNRSKEVANQFGNIYTSVLFQAYYNKSINLTKLSKLLDLKNHRYVFEMGK